MSGPTCDGCYRVGENDRRSHGIGLLWSNDKRKVHLLSQRRTLAVVTEHHNAPAAGEQFRVLYWTEKDN